MIRILLNGAQTRLTGSRDLAAVVAAALAGSSPGVPSACSSGAPTGIAAAVNDRVVPRSTWASVTLHDDDRVEIVTAVQGG